MDTSSVTRARSANRAATLAGFVRGLPLAGVNPASCACTTASTGEALPRSLTASATALTMDSERSRNIDSLVLKELNTVGGREHDPGLAGTRMVVVGRRPAARRRGRTSRTAERAAARPGDGVHRGTASGGAVEFAEQIADKISTVLDVQSNVMNAWRHQEPFVGSAGREPGPRSRCHGRHMAATRWASRPVIVIAAIARPSAAAVTRVRQ